MRNSNRGEVATIVLIVLTAIAGLWAVKPDLFPGAARRAKQNAEANAKVESATQKQGASAAASVVKIAEAAGMADPSPATDFIKQEAPVALAKLPAPDPQALLEAERRRTAVMEGRFELAKSLYAQAYDKAEKLQRDLQAAKAAQEQIALKLQEVAAAEHAKTMQLLGAGIAVVLLIALYVAAKFYGVSPRTLGAIAADIRSGEDPIVALDRNTSPRLHRLINKHARLSREPENRPIPAPRSDDLRNSGQS